MKNTIKILAITIIIAMLMPFTTVNATTSRTEKILEILKENVKSFDGTVNYENDTIEIEWYIPNSNYNTTEFSYNGNVIEYNSGEITSYEEAEDVVAHSIYAVYLIKSALRVNGYTDEEIQSFFSSETSEFVYDINGIVFENTGESKSVTSEDGKSQLTIAPTRIKIDVSKANLNTLSDGPVTPKSTTIEDIIENLQSDSSFTTLEDEGKLISKNEIYNDDNIITISNTSYMYEYHNVLFDCDNDIITYEDGEIENYYDAERALSHQLFAIQLLINNALKMNGYTTEQIQEFLEDNEFNYELNGIEFKEIGEEKNFTSEDESSTVTITPMSIKIDLVKANLKKVNELENQGKTKENTTYKILEGEGQTVDSLNSKEITFRFDIEYSKFKEDGKVYIDGELVDSKNYTSKEGSTIITFNEDYAKNIPVGEHTLKVAVADGEVSTTFKVANNTESTSIKGTNPKTGDNITIWIGLMVVSILGIAGIVKFAKRK